MEWRPRSSAARFSAASGAEADLPPLLPMDGAADLWRIDSDLWRIDISALRNGGLFASLTLLGGEPGSQSPSSLRRWSSICRAESAAGVPGNSRTILSNAFFSSSAAFLLVTIFSNWPMIWSNSLSLSVSPYCWASKASRLRFGITGFSLKGGRGDNAQSCGGDGEDTRPDDCVAVREGCAVSCTPVLWRR